MSHHEARPILFLIALIYLAISIYSCETDPCDSPTTTKHYYIPTWSPDGNTVAVVENNYANCGDPKPVHLSFIRAYDGSVIQSRVRAHYTEPYDFTYDSKYVWTFNRYPSNIDFFEFDGTKALTQGDNPIASLVDSSWNITSVAFSPFDQSFIVIKNQVSKPLGKIELHSYDSLPWKTTSKTIDSVIAKNIVRSVVWLDKTTFALRIIGGNIIIMNTDGTNFTQYSITDSNLSPIYFSHLRLEVARNLQRIYAISNKGLEMIDLNTKLIKTILDGEIRDFDVSLDERHIAFQTTSNDIWTADMDGNPEHRVLPNSREPRFSPEGNRIAGIRALSANEDQLVIVRVSQ